MPPLFHPSWNGWSKASLAALILSVPFLIALTYALSRSFYVTEVGYVPEQSIAFSHEHHAGRLGIDCRYCHTSVESASFAGMPPVKTCMNCHSHIWKDSPMLAPVRESDHTGRPLTWTRVYNLPDYVYFNHGIHVQKGIGCVSCHGPVDKMPLMWKAHTLHMNWCLDCHRNPERFVRPKDSVFEMTAFAGSRAQTGSLVREYGIRNETNCSVCHR